MSGLLKRSAQYRKRVLVEDNVKPSDLLSTDDSGISAEDRSEIMQEIDRMTSEQRTGLTPDALMISRAARRGFVFPLVVNVAMALILAGGLYGLYAFFQQEEQQLAEAEREGVGAQAELIRRIQEQAQAELEQKEREIASIQDRLGDIEARRAALETNLEEELARREAELRAELEAELAAARERLEEEGATESQIEARISSLEAEGEAEIEAELDQLRAEAEAERAELDETLAQLQSEFQGELAELQQERSQILEQAREREAELRTGFEEELSDARTELESLTDRRERERQAANQIVGYYNEIRGEIRTESYGEALATIEQLRQYLSEDSVATLPAVAQRREAELFILSSLEQLVEEEQATRTTDTEALLAQARTVQEATSLVNEGNAAFEEGNVEQAEELYQEAINLIPAVAEGHEYFVSQQRDVIAELQEQQVDRSEAADAAIADARASFAAADYGAALASYQEAISLLPQDAAPVQEVISEIRASGVALANQQAVNQQTQAAQATFERGEAALAAGDYGAALTAFTEVAESYPRSRQMELVPQAIRTTVSERTAVLQSRIDAMETEIATLEEQTAGQEESSAERQEQLIALRSRNAELQTRIEELRQELDETSARLETAREQAEEAAAAEAPEGQPTQEELTPALTAEIEEEIEQLRQIEEQYQSLRQSYLAYANREDAILDSGTDAARLQTKLLFDSFLASRPVRETLPGLRDRIKAYDRAFEEVGRETALLDTVDIVYELSTVEGPEAKLDFLEEQRAEVDDPNMEAFLDELEVLISSVR
jgi:tetratricopeptide (TPR) repeat protein